MYSKIFPAPAGSDCDLCRLDGDHRRASARFVVAETAEELDAVGVCTSYPIEMSGRGVFWDACDAHAEPGDIDSGDFMPIYHA